MKIGDIVKVTVTAMVTSVDSVGFELIDKDTELEYYFEFGNPIEVEQVS